MKTTDTVAERCNGLTCRFEALAEAYELSSGVAYPITSKIPVGMQLLMWDCIEKLEEIEKEIGNSPVLKDIGK
jgi:hypothetical protein